MSVQLSSRTIIFATVCPRYPTLWLPTTPPPNPVPPIYVLLVCYGCGVIMHNVLLGTSQVCPYVWSRNLFLCQNIMKIKPINYGSCLMFEFLTYMYFYTLQLISPALAQVMRTWQVLSLVPRRDFYPAICSLLARLLLCSGRERRRPYLFHIETVSWPGYWRIVWEATPNLSWLQVSH